MTNQIVQSRKVWQCDTLVQGLGFWILNLRRLNCQTLSEFKKKNEITDCESSTFILLLEVLSSSLKYYIILKYFEVLLKYHSLSVQG
jgi:hypothetical protein